MSAKIILQCVKAKSKLRIRFHSFTDSDGKTYGNVYDNSLNCMFPKDIRREGVFYEISGDELELVHRPGAKPFYRVNASWIKVLTPEESPTTSAASASASATPIKIYEIQECVVCMCEDSSEVLVPCGHKCMCNGCALQIFRSTRKCPICRKQVNSMLNQSA